jgi:hypothetical protein
MSRLKWILEKAAVSNEPGLSNAQLMLTNEDLRPGETETVSKARHFAHLLDTRLTGEFRMP